MTWDVIEKRPGLAAIFGWLFFAFLRLLAAVFGQALLALEGFCHISVALFCVEVINNLVQAGKMDDAH